MRARLLVLGLALAGCTAPRSPYAFSALAPGAERPRGQVEVRGPDLDAARLSVTVVPDGPRAPAAMLGETRLEAGALVFEPRFGFDRGLAYRAVFEPGAGSEVTVWTFSFEAEPLQPTTVVAAVFPSADVLPANLLKFYVHFSAPMRRGEAYRHVRLLDESGAEVQDVFLEVEPELWDPDGQRLTLFFHPGRVKRGLRMREELGPILAQEREYVLVIDPAWRDARGAGLLAEHRKVFRTRAPDRTSPDPADWTLRAPRAGTRSPLRVQLGGPLDHALLQRVVTVVGPDGTRLDGIAEVASGETEWSWTPALPWQGDQHALVIDTVLEDLAGNSVGRPFEVDDTGIRPPGGETVRRPFRPADVSHRTGAVR